MPSPVNNASLKTLKNNHLGGGIYSNYNIYLNGRKKFSYNGAANGAAIYMGGTFYMYQRVQSVV